MSEIIGALAIVGGVFGLSLLYTLWNLLQIANPSEVLIVSGKPSWLGQRRIGYSFTKGGRMVVFPIINRAHKMDLRNMTIDVTVKSAYSKGGIPLDIGGVANLKVCGDQPLLDNAIERLLGKSRQEIIQIAKETLEGNLRGVLAKLTPEQVNHDKEAFAQSLIAEADKDLQRLGLTLDNLKIQSVKDDAGYLDVIGRKKQAEVLMKSRIAEADNRATSKIREAENRQQTVLAQMDNQMKILKAEADTKIADALSRRSALVAKVQAEVGKDVAKAEADMAVQKARIDQVRHQLRADIIQPAEAGKQQAEAQARAAVASIIENGKATAHMLDQVIGSMKNAGGNARDIFLVQKLDALIAAMLRTTQKVNLDRITMIDGRLGGDSGGWTDLTAKAVSSAEQLRGTMGIDVPQLLDDLSRAVGGSGIRVPTRRLEAGSSDAGSGLTSSAGGGDRQAAAGTAQAAGVVSSAPALERATAADLVDSDPVRVESSQFTWDSDSAAAGRPAPHAPAPHAPAPHAQAHAGPGRPGAPAPQGGAVHAHAASPGWTPYSPKPRDTSRT